MKPQVIITSTFIGLLWHTLGVTVTFGVKSSSRRSKAARKRGADMTPPAPRSRPARSAKKRSRLGGIRPAARSAAN